MTLFEILSLNREFLIRLYKIGYKSDDCNYIDLYAEFERMHKQGEKVTYIISVLSSKYNISERKVYAVIKRFKKDCTKRAV